MGESFSEAPTIKDSLAATPSMSRSPSSYASSPRPGLSRANSINFSAETDDAFTGLTLLDALVVLDSHLDLASRNIKKKTNEWKVRAESTAIQVKRQAEEVLNQQRRRRRKVTGSAASAGDGQHVGSDEDRIDIDRELLKFREKIQNRVQAVRARWKDQRVVSLRDKISFFFGVELVLFSALLVGFKPEWVPGVYTALSAYLFPIRIYEYRKKHYALFLADLCYIVNVLCLLYIWVFPSSPILFVACYCLSHGPLCTAIATWRNSLVFHSVDKVTSLFIHIYPPFVFTVLRHFYPNVEEKYPALAELPTLNVWRSLLFASIAYLVWQVAYYYGIIVAAKDKIEKEGRITSFTYMLGNKRSLIGKTLAKIPPARREPTFMFGQFIYTIVTMSPSAIWLYDSVFLSVVWLITFFSVSVWNGASFYFKVMGNSKEVASLRKELEELQRVAEGGKTPASVASMPSSEPGDVSLSPSVLDTPVLGPSSSAGADVVDDTPLLGPSSVGGGVSDAGLEKELSLDISGTLTKDSPKKDGAGGPVVAFPLPVTADLKSEGKDGGNGGGDSGSDSSVILVDAPQEKEKA